MNKPRSTPKAGRKLRVLIVENREETRQVHRDNVIRWGYEPVIAEGSGDILMRTR